MKQLLLLTAILGFGLFSCVKESNQEEIKETEYNTYGDSSIIVDKALSTESALAKYEKIPVGDSTEMKFATTIQEVCQHKGCWVTLDLGNGETARVSFKDYGFFVPKDVAGRQAIVNGWAYKKEVSIEEQQHYLEDAGRPKEEIDQITEPETQYTFIADGVMIEKVSS